jgi:hypothetical protein
MSKGIKEVYVAVTAVVDDRNCDRYPNHSSVEQQAVSFDYFIYRNSSILEILY